MVQNTAFIIPNLEIKFKKWVCQNLSQKNCSGSTFIYIYILYQKRARKTLMKLTPSRSHSIEIWNKISYKLGKEWCGRVVVSNEIERSKVK